MSFVERLFVIIIWVLILLFMLMVIVNKAKQFNVSRPNLLFWDKTIIAIPLGFFLIVLSLVLYAILSPSNVTNIEALVLLPLPLMLNLYLMLRCINWRVEFRVNDFEYTDIFGKRFSFTYSQIKSIRTGQFGEVIKVGNKRIIVDILTVGNNEFHKMVDDSKIKRFIKSGRK